MRELQESDMPKIQKLVDLSVEIAKTIKDARAEFGVDDPLCFFHSLLTQGSMEAFIEGLYEARDHNRINGFLEEALLPEHYFQLVGGLETTVKRLMERGKVKRQAYIYEALQNFRDSVAKKKGEMDYEERAAMEKVSAEFERLVAQMVKPVPKKEQEDTIKAMQLEVKDFELALSLSEKQFGSDDPLVITTKKHFGFLRQAVDHIAERIENGYDESLVLSAESGSPLEFGKQNLNYLKKSLFYTGDRDLRAKALNQTISKIKKEQIGMNDDEML